MKKKKRIAMIGIWLALTIGFAVFSWQAREKALDPVTVYTMTQDIPLNSKIGLTDFQSVEVPGDAVTPDMIEDPNEIVEKDLHAATKLIQGQYALEDMFVEVEKVDPFEVIDLSDMRQVTIPANYSAALGGNVSRGDRIDLVYIGDGASEKSGNYTYSRTFAEDVLVYAVTTNGGYRFEDHSDRLEGTPMASSEDEIAEGDGVSAGDIAQITLAVSPELSEEISTRLATGSIRVVGRFDESENSDTAGYVIGEFERQFSGQGNPEANK